MAGDVLRYTGTAVGSVVGGPEGAAIAFVSNFLGDMIDPGPRNSIYPEIVDVSNRKLTEQNVYSPSAEVPVLYGYGTISPNITYIGKVYTSGNPLDPRTRPLSDFAVCLVGVFCEGPIKNIDTIYVNGKEISTFTPGSSTSSSVTADTRLGLWPRETAYTKVVRDDAASGALNEFSWLDSSEYTAAHRLDGFASACLVELYNTASGVTDIGSISGDIQGRALDNETASAWLYPGHLTTDRWRNPVIQILDFFTDTRYGAAIPFDKIHRDSWLAAADKCLENFDWSGNGDIENKFEADFVFYPSRAKSSITSLLNACNGAIIEQEGQFRFLIKDAVDASDIVFTVTEDNLVGEVQVFRSGADQKFNRVIVGYTDRTRGGSLEQVIIDSPDIRNLYDRGFLSTKSITISSISDEWRARYFGQVILEQSRQDVFVSLTVTRQGFDIQLFDVIMLSLPVYGWDTQNGGTGKYFRVLGMRASGGTVALKLEEYAASVYDQTMDVVDTAPNTDLPEALDVPIPYALIITEVLYMSRQAGGVKAKATLTWLCEEPMAVYDYQLWFTGPNNIEWSLIGNTTDTTYEILDATPGDYAFKVRARHYLGFFGDFSDITYSTITGLSAPPATPSGFSGLLNSQDTRIVILTWDAATDLDVTFGGHFEIRHSTSTTSATWSASNIVAKRVSGIDTTAAVVAAVGTYLIKAVDSSGVFSSDSALWVGDDLPGATGTTVITQQYIDPWHLNSAAGIQENATGTLELVTPGTTGETVLYDASGGPLDVSLPGPLPRSIKLEATIDYIPVLLTSLSETIDDRTGDVDDWPSWDGAGTPTTDNAWARMYISISVDGGSSWGSFYPLFNGQILYATDVKLKIKAFSDSAVYNVAITSATLMATQN